MDMSLNIIQALKCPFFVLVSITAISFTALATAFASEAFLGLEPCILCIYQRWPYALVIAFGVLGLVFRKKPKIAKAMVGLSGLAFLVNSGIALYHSGVEQKWWRSAVEGCAVPGFGDEPKNILDNIMSAPTAACDEIPWQDPLLGLSMANYNVILCFALFCVCAISFSVLRHAKECHASHKA